MKYTIDDAWTTFSVWCESTGVKQAEPLPPIINGKYSKHYKFIVGTYTIPNGISGWGIAVHTNESGAINVIMRTDSLSKFIEMMQFAMTSIGIINHNKRIKK